MIFPFAGECVAGPKSLARRDHYYILETWWKGNREWGSRLTARTHSGFRVSSCLGPLIEIAMAGKKAETTKKADFIIANRQRKKRAC